MRSITGYTWLVLVIVLAFLIHMIFMMALPWRIIAPPHWDTLFLAPHSDVYGYIWLREKPPSGAESSGTISMTLYSVRVPTAYAGDMHVYTPSLAYQAYDVSKRRITLSNSTEDSLSTDGIQAWMQACGVETDTDQVRAEAEELYTVLKRMANGASLAETADNMHNFRVEIVPLVRSVGFRGPVWFLYVEILFWSVIWLLGVVYLRRRSVHKVVQ